MQLCRALMLLAALLLLLPAMASAESKNFCPVERDQSLTPTPASHEDVAPLRSPADPPPFWEGKLRVYVVEHMTSMGWNDGDGDPYEFPFLAYAINSNMIALNEGTWDTTVTWDGYDFGYNNLQEGNIAVQAVLFSATNGLPEAAAMADPGVPGSSEVESEYTHTVFVEEGTATW